LRKPFLKAPFGIPLKCGYVTTFNNERIQWGKLMAWLVTEAEGLKFKSLSIPMMRIGITILQNNAREPVVDA